MNKTYKVFTAILIAVFIISCMAFVGVADDHLTSPSTTAVQVTTVPIISSSTSDYQTTTYSEQTSSTGWETNQTDFSTEEDSTIQSITSQSITRTTVSRTTDAGRTSPQWNYQTHDNETYTKTTRSTAAKTIETTEQQKNIVNFADRFRLIKYASFFLMMLSLIGLIYTNLKHAKSKPKQSIKRKHKKKARHKRK